MSKTEQQITQEEVIKDPKQEKTAVEYEDNDPVTVIWKKWGTSAVPADKTTYFDRQTFVSGVSRRVPYAIAKKWLKQGHGILVLGVDATDADFMKATGHQPIEDNTFSMLLRATSSDKLAALLGPEALEKLASLRSKK